MMHHDHCYVSDAHVSLRFHLKWSVLGRPKSPLKSEQSEDLRHQPFALNQRRRFSSEPRHGILGTCTAPFSLTCTFQLFGDTASTSPSMGLYLSSHSFSSTWFIYQQVVFSNLHSFLSFLTFSHRPILLKLIRSDSILVNSIYAKYIALFI